ncbi:MAG: MurR/RpiR family transcriptional regulator [Romboutsia sp.]|uniref:MurR/RpiR family transcriptional regulator n=1 Tax=Romboutsia sp. TaxID=1965302 RepID=UPI003F2C51A5
MQYSDNTVLKNLKSRYDQFTNVEKTIANFFINNKETTKLSSKSIAEKLFVSEASLSRFSKKCGYKGFREFIFEYEKNISKYNKEEISNLVINTYQDLLDSCHRMIDQEQMKKVAHLLTTSNRVCVFGMGSSGIVAEEINLRFMRLGLNIESVHDSHRIKMLSSLANKDSVIIAISLSGTTKEILQGISIAKSNGAKVIMITSNRSFHLVSFCDEIILIPTIKDLEAGDCISPQFPVLIMVDVLYTYFINTECYYKTKLSTLNGLFKFEDESILI